MFQNEEIHEANRLHGGLKAVDDMRQSAGSLSGTESAFRGQIWRTSRGNSVSAG